MKKMIALLAIPFILMGCGFDREQPDESDPKNRSVSQYNDSGPQDIICHSGSLVTYEHKNVILYRDIENSRGVLYVYENDTQEKVILPISQCMLRPHKKN